MTITFWTKIYRYQYIFLVIYKEKYFTFHLWTQIQTVTLTVKLEFNNHTYVNVEKALWQKSLILHTNKVLLLANLIWMLEWAFLKHFVSRLSVCLFKFLTSGNEKLFKTFWHLQIFFLIKHFARKAETCLKSSSGRFKFVKIIVVKR